MWRPFTPDSHPHYRTARHGDSGLIMCVLS